MKARHAPALLLALAACGGAEPVEIIDGEAVQFSSLSAGYTESVGCTNDREIGLQFRHTEGLLLGTYGLVPGSTTPGSVELFRGGVQFQTLEPTDAIVVELSELPPTAGMVDGQTFPLSGTYRFTRDVELSHVSPEGEIEPQRLRVPAHTFSFATDATFGRAVCVP